MRPIWIILRDLSRDVTVGLFTLAETGEDTITDLLPNGEAFARDMQTAKPDRKAILVTGGTAVGTLWAQSLAKTDGFRNVDVTGNRRKRRRWWVVVMILSIFLTERVMVSFHRRGIRLIRCKDSCRVTNVNI